MKKVIKLESLDITANKLMCRFSYSKEVKKYFLTDIFFFEYSGVDISTVDESILIIPALSAIISVAWAVGAQVYVDKLDRTYLDSLERVQDTFRHFYPQFSFATDIYARNVVSNIFGKQGAGLLFSGGIDSMTAYAVRRGETGLILVWGADIDYRAKDFWRKVISRIHDFAKQEKVRLYTARTNMREINEMLLAREFKTYDWWAGVAHGLSLLGVCAPITAVTPIGILFIAASHTKDYREPWGSHPLIDNNVRWADIRVFHSNYELGRTEKVAYLKSFPQLLSYLRVCYSSSSNYNCGQCEKCLRTITALILNGIDPRTCNFNIDTGILRYVRDCFTKGKIRLTKNEIFMWKDIQTHIPAQIAPDIYNSKEFYGWFKEFDISGYRENKVRHFLWDISHQLKYKRTNTKEVMRWVVGTILQLFPGKFQFHGFRLMGKLWERVFHQDYEL